MNRLHKESSPYLLQHAHNPVDWYPWSDEALNRAKEENKPILVSIGYAACHWCHVMERESFEKDDTAAYMNAHFVNIKIDREERPDLDHIYMDAVQAMTGSGGWPLNVFLTPEGKPFFGGTYYPPVKAFNRSSWMDVLESVTEAFETRRHEIDAQADNLTQHLLQANSVAGTTGTDFGVKELQQMFEQLMKTADKEWGGFGRAPKFPQTFTIQFLLQFYHISGNEEALQQAMLSLDKMIAGGIYDQFGGGFSRYSTDTEWLAPHFEKMLYDNALLISVLSDAWQITRKERYKEVIAETFEFLERECMDASGGFYAALDADSEGVEGKFYTWSKQEVQKVMGADADLFCQYYDITDEGNWEHQSIARVLMDDIAFASANGISIDALRAILKSGRQSLMQIRGERIRPALDDKQILGWNSLMNTAASKAYAATGVEHYRDIAVRNMDFLLNVFSGEGLYRLSHTFKNGEAKYPAFLDDYAYTIQALVILQEVTADTTYLDRAKELMEFVIENFSEEETGYFFFTHQAQSDVIIRKKEMYDGAVPSGNAIMAKNLRQLGLLFDRSEWVERAAAMVRSLGKALVKYPGSFGNWCSLAAELVSGTKEIAVIGKRYEPLLKEVLARYIPFRVLMASNKPHNMPLVVGKPVIEKTNIWLCEEYSCKAPVESVEELITLINRGDNGKLIFS
jgi:uncharacterized protein YyaL (SSP411 family)